MNISDIELSTSALTLPAFVDRLMDLMPQLCRAMVRHERNFVDRGDLTLQQIWALEMMRERQGCSMHDLVAGLQLKPSTASMFVDRMVEMRVARRVRSTSDRRAVSLAITPKGRRILAQMEKSKRVGMMALYKPFTAAERVSYLALLQKLVRDLSHPLTPNKRRLT